MGAQRQRKGEGEDGEGEGEGKGSATYPITTPPQTPVLEPSDPS